MSLPSRVRNLAVPVVITVATASGCQPATPAQDQPESGCEPPDCVMNPPGVEPTAEPTAVASTPAPDSPASVKLPPLESNADLEKWLMAPCFAIAANEKRFACISADLDMGVVTADFTVLSVEDGSVVAKHTIYAGPSEIDAAKLRKPQIDIANALLRGGKYKRDGKPIDVKSVVYTPDGYFRLELTQASGTASPRSMMGKRPAFTTKDAPDGFTGDPNACMKWKAAGGMYYRASAALRIEAEHSFTSEKGKPCSVAGELNDETFPAEERWLILRAK